eukprot:Hpha_TRINITY_DN14869_c5_g12::TRINITY_DN14869_c5_g12_i1::g.169639::m.169639
MGHIFFSEPRGALAHRGGTLAHHLVQDGGCGLDGVDTAGRLADEQRLRLDDRKGPALLLSILDVVAKRGHPLRKVLGHLLLPGALPHLNVLGLVHAARPAGERKGLDGVTGPCLDDRLLVLLRTRGFLARNEPGPDPHRLCAEREGCGHRATVVDPPCSNNVDRTTGEGRGATLAPVHTLRDEHHRRDLTAVPSSLVALCADHVHTTVQGLFDVLGGADHVHDDNTGLVQLLHNPLGGDTDGADEEAGLALDDEVDELREGTVSVVVVGLTRATAHLGQQKVDSEGGLVVEQRLDFIDLLPEHGGRHRHPSNHTETTRVRNGSRELSSSDIRHTRENDGVLDLEDVADGGLDGGGRHC